MAKLSVKDGVVEIVPSKNPIKVLKEKNGIKTIEIETPFKKKKKAGPPHGSRPRARPRGGWTPGV